MVVDWGQVWLGLGPALLATGIAYLGLKQARRKDSDAARSGLLSNHREGTGQMIGGYSGLVDQLQEENTKCLARLDASNADRDALRLEVARLRKRLRDNDTPNPPVK